MADAGPSSSLPAPLVALAGWVLPGLGYLLIGQRTRGVIAGAAIVLTFVVGLLIGGVRVIDVPGYDPAGDAKMVPLGRGDDKVWALKANFQGEVMNKPWYIAQSLVGPLNVLATWGSLAAGRAGHRMSTARVFDIGTLYTAVAGMLNLLIVIDATYRSTRPPLPEYEAAPAPSAPAKRAGDAQELADAAAVTAATDRARDAARDDERDDAPSGGPA